MFPRVDGTPLALLVAPKRIRVSAVDRLSLRLSSFAFVNFLLCLKGSTMKIRYSLLLTACGLLAMMFSRTKKTWVMKSSTNGVTEVRTRHSLASSSA